MGKKLFFSIKNKIILSLVIVLLTLASFNLYSTYSMVKKDKEAYIFANAIRNAEVVSIKIQDYMKIMSEKLAKSIKISDSEVYLAGELKQNTEEFVFNYNDNSYSNAEEKIKDIVKKLPKESKNKLIPFPLEKNILLTLKHSEGVRFALVSQQMINENLTNDNIFEYIVINNKNQVFFGEKGLVSSFNNVVQPNLNQSSSTVEFGEENYLTSYSKIQPLKMIVFGYINQEKAFAVIKSALIKNIGYSTVIIGILLIISLLFSKKITNPIIQLIAKTSEIAEGNLDGEVVVKTNDELRELGSSVNIMSSKIKKLLDDKQDMIQQLEVANAKLDEYNKNLESIVAERTKELREANNFITAMINSLDQGLFVFDKTKQCLDIFTNACEAMFNRIPKNLDVPKLLGLKGNEEEAFEKWANVIFSNMMPFEAAKNLGPKNVVKSAYGKSDFQFISLDYYPMMDDDEKLENVVVVATDKTAEVEAEERFKEKDAYVSMILNIIKSKKAFYDFLDEMEEMLVNLSDFDKHEDLANIAMIAFHSMNGGFANYSISHLVKVARASETQIKSFIGNRKELENLLVYLIENFRKERDQMIREIETQLADSKNKVEIEKSELTELKSRIEKGEDPSFLYTEYFEKSKVKSIFTPYADLIMQISKKISKPMMPLLIIGGDIRVNTDKIKEFSSALVHLFRNCMDHGIETPDKRAETDKPAEGSITITCSKPSDDRVKIVVQDDGAGIAVPKIREILTKKGIDHSNLSDKEAMMYIFKPDFSTAEKLTELSGRGVGMSAIDQAIRNLGGKLDLESTPGKGSKFIFELPI